MRKRPIEVIVYETVRAKELEDIAHPSRRAYFRGRISMGELAIAAITGLYIQKIQRYLDDRTAAYTRGDVEFIHPASWNDTTTSNG